MTPRVQVGDGTTTVTILAGELLRLAKPFIEDGEHPKNIIHSFRKCLVLATEFIRSQATSIAREDRTEMRALLCKCAETTLNSKLIAGEKEFFAEVVVDAVMSLEDVSRPNLIGIKRVQGGAMRDSFLVKGVAFKKTFSYAGFEQQPKFFRDPHILLLNLELEVSVPAGSRTSLANKAGSPFARGGP